MRFNKFDIGAEIIAILTRGMYPDPKDALRDNNICKRLIVRYL